MWRLVFGLKVQILRLHVSDTSFQVYVISYIVTAHALLYCTGRVKLATAHIQDKQGSEVYTSVYSSPEGRGDRGVEKTTR